MQVDKNQADVGLLRGAARMARSGLQASPLMDVARFTRQLEDTLIALYRRTEAEERHKTMHAKTILHVGPGHRDNGAPLPAAFQGSDW